jgi:hypothetical protein
MWLCRYVFLFIMISWSIGYTTSLGPWDIPPSHLIPSGAPLYPSIVVDNHGVIPAAPTLWPPHVSSFLSAVRRIPVWRRHPSSTHTASPNLLRPLRVCLPHLCVQHHRPKQAARPRPELSAYDRRSAASANAGARRARRHQRFSASGVNSFYALTDRRRPTAAETAPQPQGTPRPRRRSQLDRERRRRLQIITAGDTFAI